MSPLRARNKGQSARCKLNKSIHIKRNQFKITVMEKCKNMKLINPTCRQELKDNSRDRD